MEKTGLKNGTATRRGEVMEIATEIPADSADSFFESEMMYSHASGPEIAFTSPFRGLSIRVTRGRDLALRITGLFVPRYSPVFRPVDGRRDARRVVLCRLLGFYAMRLQYQTAREAARVPLNKISRAVEKKVQSSATRRSKEGRGMTKGKRGGEEEHRPATRSISIFLYW